MKEAEDHTCQRSTNASRMASLRSVMRETTLQSFSFTAHTNARSSLQEAYLAKGIELS